MLSSAYINLLDIFVACYNLYISLFLLQSVKVLIAAVTESTKSCGIYHAKLNVFR